MFYLQSNYNITSPSPVFDKNISAIEVEPENILKTKTITKERLDTQPVPQKERNFFMKSKNNNDNPPSAPKTVDNRLEKKIKTKNISIPKEKSTTDYSPQKTSTPIISNKEGNATFTPIENKGESNKSNETISRKVTMKQQPEAVITPDKGDSNTSKTIDLKNQQNPDQKRIKEVKNENINPFPAPKTVDNRLEKKIKTKNISIPKEKSTTDYSPQKTSTPIISNKEGNATFTPIENKGESNKSNETISRKVTMKQQPEAVITPDKGDSNTSKTIDLKNQQNPDQKRIKEVKNENINPFPAPKTVDNRLEEKSTTDYSPQKTSTTNIRNKESNATFISVENKGASNKTNETLSREISVPSKDDDNKSKTIALKNQQNPGQKKIQELGAQISSLSRELEELLRVDDNNDSTSSSTSKSQELQLGDYVEITNNYKGQKGLRGYITAVSQVRVAVSLENDKGIISKAKTSLKLIHRADYNI